MDIDRLLAKAAAEQDAGKPWRAREVLSSAIPQAGFEPRLFLAFGQLLLELGEQHEAGKYLLLSGARQPEFDEAIALIVRRLGKPHAHRLYAAFPRVARLPMLSDYPQPLADELRALGLPEKLSPERPEWMSAANSPTPASPLMACLLLAILGTGFLLVLAVGLHRCVQLVEMWLKQH